MLTIFANMKINTPDRFQRFKDSFLSFSSISDNWLINIRGIYRRQALDFLRPYLGNKMIEFELLDDKRGWSRNALVMLEKAKYDYIFVWVEDHINMAPVEIYPKIIKEMADNKVDHIFYSWWFFGKFRNYFDKVNKKSLEFIDVVDFTQNVWNKLKEAGHNEFLISLTGIFRKELFKKILVEDAKKFPHTVSKVFYKFLHLPRTLGFPVSETTCYGWFRKLNHLVFQDKLLIYSPETPFNLEKENYRRDYLPFTFAIPRHELFACIDKDNNMSGYSLVNRGLYSLSEKSQFISCKENVNLILNEINQVLSKIDEKQVNNLVDQIISSKNIVVAGAGRVGMAGRGFAMRLAHMGLKAYFIGDSNVPALGKGDILLACSGSGETQTTYDLVEIAKKNQATVCLVTGNRDSRMGRKADCIVEILAPSKTKEVEGLASLQPMTTLNEQCLSIFFDALVLRITEQLNEGHDTMWKRHSNLE